MNRNLNIQRTISTNLAVEEILSRFDKYIEKPKWYQVGVPENNLEILNQTDTEIDLQVQTFYRRSNMPVFSCLLQPSPNGTEIKITPKDIIPYFIFIMVAWVLFLIGAIFFQNYNSRFDVVSTATLVLLFPPIGIGIVYFFYYWYIDQAVNNIKKILNKC
jgi:hypothetical protein